METRTVELPELIFRGSIEPSSFDAEKREFDVVLATETPVERSSFFEGPWVETLGLRDGEVDLSRAARQIPLFYVHGRPGMSELKRTHIGTIFNVRRDDAGPVRRILGRAKLSARDEVKDIGLDVRDGILPGMSAGYRVRSYRDETPPGTTVPRRRAVDWQLLEGSLTPMPLDVVSGVRSREASALERCSVLPFDAADAADAATTRGRGAMEVVADPAAKKLEEDKAARERAAAEAAAKTRDDAAAAEKRRSDELAAATKSGAELERSRIDQIRSDCKASALPETFADELVKRGVPAAEAGRSILDELRRIQKEKPAASGQVRVGTEAIDHVRSGIEEALMVRGGLADKSKISENGRRFSGMTMLRMIEELEVAKAGGRALEDYSVAKMVERALAFSSSDFPKITENVANKAIRKGYEAAAPTYRRISRQTSAPDFKPMSRVQIGLGSSLAEVQSNGEIQYATFGESKESYQLKTFGRIAQLTRRAIMDDDTGAFDRVPTALGRQAAVNENVQAWFLITSNVTLGSDSTALFHANHGNLDSAAKVLGEAGLSSMRSLMRLVKDPDGTILNLNPRTLIVPAALETTGWKNVIAPVDPSSVAGTSPFRGLLELVVEPLLDANSVQAYYLAAGLDQIDILEHAYLNGQAGPSVQTFYDPRFDGVLYRVLHDFAVGVVEYRGINKSAGTNP